MSNNTRLTVSTPTASSILTELNVSVGYNADFAVLNGNFIIPAGTYGQGQTLFTLPFSLKARSFEWLIATSSGTLYVLRIRANGIVEFNSNYTFSGASNYFFLNGVVF